MVSYGASPVHRPSLLKRMLPRTLFGRSLLIILLPLVLLQIISTWVFLDRHYGTTTKRLAQGVAGDIAVVVQLLVREPGTVSRLQIFRLANRAMRVEFSFTEAGRLPENTTRASLNIFTNTLTRKLTIALGDYVGRPFLIRTGALDDDVEILIQLANGVLRVLIPHERLFSPTTYIFIMWMVGSSIVLFGVAVIFMRNQIKPIRRLAHAADSFGKGRDVADFKAEGAMEVRQAATAFLRMRDRIRRQIDQRTEFLAGVSHDLRTPLTRMKLQLALLRDVSEAKDLESDVAEMERMVEGYLAFARGEGTEIPQETDVAALLLDVVTQMRRDGATIDLHVEEAVTLPLRREAMRRCLTNLIGNAGRHGEHVSVRMERRRKAIDITIDDDGPGIPEDRREDVFRPFFRLEQSRNPVTGGVGLGLSIARDMVRNHGGDLTLGDAPDGGLRARIWLPF
ncbi:MAG: ATP-binding protein [Proteobacteria bacterium]|nr:ATP-binding protein [Pseudomonadota bacterium]